MRASASRVVIAYGSMFAKMRANAGACAFACAIWRGSCAHCARSRVHKAWPFSAPAHTPSTIDIRAYAQSGEGDNPSRPALELEAR